MIEISSDGNRIFGQNVKSLRTVGPVDRKSYQKNVLELSPVDRKSYQKNLLELSPFF